MKKLHLLSILSVGALLTACGSPQAVSVAKATDQSVVRPPVVTKQVNVPDNLPANVTAICRDGSYSTATVNSCSGNGGVATVVSHHYAD